MRTLAAEKQGTETEPPSPDAEDMLPPNIWTVYDYEEAAAEIQKSPECSTVPGSALNEEFEYTLPNSLKLVGSSTEEQRSSRGLTPLERRMGRRLDRYLAKLSANAKVLLHKHCSLLLRLLRLLSVMFWFTLIILKSLSSMYDTTCKGL